jgi:16S rRNA (cytosine967-C5)-methyltransferase
MSRISPARRIAAHVLQRIERAGAFADLALGGEIERGHLGSRDAALATEIVFGVLRWRRLLDALLIPHSRRPLDHVDPDVLTVLRMAVYQIVFLGRVPEAAAVNDAVSLARQRAKPGAPDFVNAVLRSFVRRRPRERRPALPPDPLERLAIRCSFPTWLAGRWIARYGADEAERLMLAMNERPPLTVRANTLRTDRHDLARRLRAEEGLRAEPTRYAPEGLVVEHGVAPDQWRAFGEGAVTPQDEASMLVSHLLGPEPEETVGDVCAAPGTKTTHLAILMRDTGRVIACDPERRRLALLRGSLARLGLTIAEPHESTVEALAPRFAATCHRVLVDAPCSNLGVLRRNPDVKWRRTAEDIARAPALQQSILAAAAIMVRPGGYLVYATCSLEPEENDEVTRAFLAAQPSFAVEAPAEFPIALDAGGTLRCLPHRHGTDGFTAIRLRRRD